MSTPNLPAVVEEAPRARREGAGQPGVSRLLWRGPEGAPLLHFAHANGFNAETYRRILRPLSARATVIAPDLRGHGRTVLPADPHTHYSWWIYRDDLIAQIEALNAGPIVLAGHSMGGTISLMTAAARPDLVAGLVLADPVILPRPAYWGARLRTLAKRRSHDIPIARAAAKRRAEFPSRADMFDAYKGRGAFKTWPDDILRDYIEGGSLDMPDGGVRLACAPAWEAANYSAQDHNLWPLLESLRCPVTLLRATEKSTCRPPVAKKLREALPAMKDVEVRGSHFFPMEQPDRLRTEILQMLDVAEGV